VATQGVIIARISRFLRESDILNIMPDEHPQPDLIPLLYEELRAIARRQLRGDRVAFSLQPTELVHEAFLRVENSQNSLPEDRNHCLALVAGMMRHLLVDHARARQSQKRGGGWVQVALSEDLGAEDQDVVDVLALDAAVLKLAKFDQRSAEIVQMQYFGGMQESEIASQMGVSERWVRKLWAHARAWLCAELAPKN